MDHIKSVLPHSGIPPTLLCAELSEPSGKRRANPLRVPLAGSGCDSVLRPILERAGVSTNSYSADYEIAIFSGQALGVLATAVDDALGKVESLPDEWREYDQYRVTNPQLRATTERLQELVRYAIANSLSVSIVFD